MNPVADRKEVLGDENERNWSEAKCSCLSTIRFVSKRPPNSCRRHRRVDTGGLARADAANISRWMDG